MEKIWNPKIKNVLKPSPVKVFPSRFFPKGKSRGFLPGFSLEKNSHGFGGKKKNFSFSVPRIFFPKLLVKKKMKKPPSFFFKTPKKFPMGKKKNFFSLPSKLKRWGWIAILKGGAPPLNKISKFFTENPFGVNFPHWVFLRKKWGLKNRTAFFFKKKNFKI